MSQSFRMAEPRGAVTAWCPVTVVLFVVLAGPDAGAADELRVPDCRDYCPNSRQLESATAVALCAPRHAGGRYIL
jgi:hypothetical protein